ncbi:MAG: GTP cyclohydrolase FolE2 [bacterium]|nr:GTP cyclohydrolase FolE2 [bacterium]
MPSNHDPLPDVADVAVPPVRGGLNAVGMRDIAMPVAIALSRGHERLEAALVGLGVDLVQPDARGVHMSRLYLAADRLLSAETVTPGGLRELLRESIDSQSGLSRGGFVRIRGGLTLRRPALISANSGHRRYPVELLARLDPTGGFRLEECVHLDYSSTCPCSAALARQLTRQHFERDFAEQPNPGSERVAEWLASERGMPATPHSQRSVAEIRIQRSAATSIASDCFPIDDLIDRCETALGTPVQTAVKRADEQEFALRNGQNLMFCEDAARRLQDELDKLPDLEDYRIQVSHLESLHAHDAVAVAARGVPGGFPGAFD